jgi:hypothetical protein
MKITTVTVGLSRTTSLPDYANIKPSISLTAELDESDAMLDVVDDLSIACCNYIESEIDSGLERNGQSPIYDTISPRFHVLSCSHARVTVILPAGTETPHPEEYWLTHVQAVRLTAALAALDAARRTTSIGNTTLLDCTEMDPETALQRVLTWWDSRPWCIPYGLPRYADDRRTLGAILIVSPPSEAPDESYIWMTPIRNEDGARLAESEFLHPELEEILDRDYPDLPRLHAHSRLEFDVLVSDWLYAHPCPEHEISPGF